MLQSCMMLIWCERTRLVDTLYVIHVDAAEALQSLRRATPHGLPLSLRLPEDRRTWRGRYVETRAFHVT